MEIAIEIESSFRVIDSLGLLLFTISFGNLFVKYIGEFSGKFCEDSAFKIQRSAFNSNSKKLIAKSKDYFVPLRVPGGKISRNFF